MPNCLQNWLHHFAFHSATNGCSCCFISIPAFGIISILDFGCAKRCVTVLHCYFNFQFPNDMWFLRNFHIPICHRYIFLGWYLCIWFFLLQKKWKTNVGKICKWYTWKMTITKYMQKTEIKTKLNDKQQTTHWLKNGQKIWTERHHLNRHLNKEDTQMTNKQYGKTVNIICH